MFCNVFRCDLYISIYTLFFVLYCKDNVGLSLHLLYSGSTPHLNHYLDMHWIVMIKSHCKWRFHVMMWIAHGNLLHNQLQLIITTSYIIIRIIRCTWKFIDLLQGLLLHIIIPHNEFSKDWNQQWTIFESALR